MLCWNIFLGFLFTNLYEKGQICISSHPHFGSKALSTEKQSIFISITNNFWFLSEGNSMTEDVDTHTYTSKHKSMSTCFRLDFPSEKHDQIKKTYLYESIFILLLFFS